MDVKGPLFLCGKRTLELLESKLDQRTFVLETIIDGTKKECRITYTEGNHYGRKKTGQGVFFFEDY